MHGFRSSRIPRPCLLFGELQTARVDSKIWLAPPTVITGPSAFAVPKWRPVARTGRTQFHSETFRSPGKSHFYRLHDPLGATTSGELVDGSGRGVCLVFLEQKRGVLEHTSTTTRGSLGLKTREEMFHGRGLTIETVGWGGYKGGA